MFNRKLVYSNQKVRFTPSIIWNINIIVICYQLQDVAAFLEEMETSDVLLDAVLKSQNARVTVSSYELNLELTLLNS